MDEKKKEDAVVGEAGKIACAWLSRHGFELKETAEIGLDGSELNGGMEIRPLPGRTVSMNRTLPAWDWAGRCIPAEDAWLTVARWLFSSDVDGPSRVRETSSSTVSRGWSRVRRRRFPVPKLAFSTLEEFVLKASVHPDFPSSDEEVS